MARRLSKNLPVEIILPINKKNDAELLQQELANIIVSTIEYKNGQEGSDAAIERASLIIQELKNSWDKLHANSEVEEFCRDLFKIIEAVDEDRMRLKGAVLRSENKTISKTTGEPIDIGASVNLIEKIILSLCDQDQELFLENLIKINQLVKDHWSCQFLLNLVLARQFINLNRSDEAIPLIKTNLALSTGCHISQKLLYDALLKLKESGSLTEKSEIPLYDLSDRFCDQPFKYLTTAGSRTQNAASTPSVYACQCPMWLPYDLVDQDQEATYENIWNGAKAQEVRRSILDGDYSYCSRMMCPSITYDLLPKRIDVTDPELKNIIENHQTKIDLKPSNMLLAHDGSCNIACPSCRKSLFVVNKERQQALDDFADNVIYPSLGEHSTTIIISGDGDPFSSNHYRRLVRNIDPVKYSGVKLVFLTNGLLLTQKEWESLAHIHKLINCISVTIDAGTKGTYEDVRRPGKWSTLTDNMTFLAQLRKDNKIPSLMTNFVVQKKNYEEIPEFINLSRNHWNADHIRLMKIINFGTFSSNELSDNDVTNPQHPLFDKFCEVMRHPNLKLPGIDMWMPNVDLEVVTGSDNHTWLNNEI
jgi:hypothetical protein